MVPPWPSTASAAAVKYASSAQVSTAGSIVSASSAKAARTRAWVAFRPASQGGAWPQRPEEVASGHRRDQSEACPEPEPCPPGGDGGVAEARTTTVFGGTTGAPRPTPRNFRVTGVRRTLA